MPIDFASAQVVDFPFAHVRGDGGEAIFFIVERRTGAANHVDTFIGGGLSLDRYREHLALTCPEALAFQLDVVSARSQVVENEDAVVVLVCFVESNDFAVGILQSHGDAVCRHVFIE